VCLPFRGHFLRPGNQQASKFACPFTRAGRIQNSRLANRLPASSAGFASRAAVQPVVSAGGNMNRALGFVLLLSTLVLVSPAKADTSTNVKCVGNEDRVWVYESLTDFNVAAKLKCGDPIQIIGRVKGYVQVQTPNGTEGYVLDTEIPKSALPPAPVEKPNDVESASLAFAATRASKPSNPSIDSPSKGTSSAPTKTNWISSTTVPNHSAAASPSAPSQPQPQVIAAEQPAPNRAPAPAENSSQPDKPTPTVAISAPVPAAPKTVARTTPAPTKPASPPPAAPTPVAVAASVPAPAPAPANVAPATSNSNDATPTIELSSADNSEPAPAAAPQPPATQPVTKENARVDAHITVSAKIRPVAAPVDPDGDVETSVEALRNDTANCALYFSAYGLSANQYKWIAQNRTKAFPSVCPAPNPSMVDFVVIFTHDVAFYNVTMPSAIHTDQNGLSDWTPLTTVDTAVISASDADHSHHEYVWVFHTKRGAFDPSAFSSRRRPLFSKSETNMLGSRGGFRTVMDALTFIEQNGTNR
jgi:hypothetical protein